MQYLSHKLLNILKIHLQYTSSHCRAGLSSTSLSTCSLKLVVKAIGILKGTAGQLMILIFLQSKNSVYEKVQKAYEGQRAPEIGLLGG